MQLKRRLPIAIVAAALWGCVSTDGQGAKGARVRFGVAQDDAVARCIRESGRPDDFHAVETRYLDEKPMPRLSPGEAERPGGPALWLVARREGVDDLRYLQTLDALIDMGHTRANGLA